MDEPCYLFRSYSPGSDGSNSITGFASMATAAGHHGIKSLAQLDWGEARNVLKDHVLWESRKWRDNDVLISFSSSFLFALQHCVRKISTCWKTTPSNCYVCIVDTSKYPRHKFTWTIDLLKHYKLDERDDKRLLQKYHEPEYLAEYELWTTHSDAAISVSLKTSSPRAIYLI